MGDGKVTTNLGATDYAYAMALQKDGKIVLAGTSDGNFALARYTPGGGLDASFDGDGKAITDTGGTDTAWALAIQLDGKIIAAGQRVASGTVEDIALVRYHDAVRLYVQQDANFNVTAVTDSAGTVLERYIYEPYGSFTVLDADWALDADGLSDNGQTHLHQGGRYDAVSGLYHFRNRDFSPSLGRWVQQDPMGYVDGMSLYEYVRSGPSTGVDPEGTCSVIPPVGRIRNWVNRMITNWPNNIQRIPVSPTDQPWMDEKKEIIDLAERWNPEAPDWSWDYQCSEQAAGLLEFLDSRNNWTYWSFQIIGARTKGAGWSHTKHHVVVVQPKAWHTPSGRPNGEGVEVKNPEGPFILDPFHNECTGHNVKRQVTVMTFAEFATDYPYWIDDLSAYQPRKGTVLPTGGPVHLPPPPPPIRDKRYEDWFDFVMPY